MLEDGEIAWPEGRPGAHARAPAAALEAAADRRARLRPRHAVHGRGPALLEAIAHHAAVALEHGRAVMRGVLAQEIHHRVKNNLQTVASLLRLQARATDVDPRKALDDSVNRILAIAAVHEVLTEHREDDVDLGELIERLRAMLVQGLVAGKEVEAELEPVSLAGHRATALALVFCELFQNALEHGGATRPDRARARATATSLLAIADDGAGIDGDAATAPASRSCARSSATSSAARSSSAASQRPARARCVFPACSPGEDPDRRGRDDHPAGPARAARERRASRSAPRRATARRRSRSRGPSSPTSPCST